MALLVEQVSASPLTPPTIHLLPIGQPALSPRREGTLGPGGGTVGFRAERMLIFRSLWALLPMLGLHGVPRWVYTAFPADLSLWQWSRATLALGDLGWQPVRALAGRALQPNATLVQRALFPSLPCAGLPLSIPSSCLPFSGFFRAEVC